jgi:Raf kinase inhibitor-like YbhB/YbcL family protein
MADNVYGSTPEVPALAVSSPDFADGDRLPDAQVSAGALATGEDRSPALEWGPAPEGTQSFAVTCWDPDAPTGSGFWHWAVYNIPADVTSLPAGAGTPDSDDLPIDARTLRNDGGVAGYAGAAPPVGHGEHRYIFAVHALDTTLDLPEGATPAALGFNMFGHTLGRGLVTGVWDR